MQGQPPTRPSRAFASFPPALVLLGAWMLIATGCSEDTTIRSYKVAKSKPVATGGESEKLLAAILPRKDSSWFFKLSGSPSKIAELEPQFREIIQSVKFDGDGPPTWQLKDGWVEQPGNSITYAKLAQTEKGLVATVSRFAGEQSQDEKSWREWVVMNVNRWRGQLSLEEKDWDGMQGDLEELTPFHQQPARAYYVSLTGTGKGGNPMGGGMSGPFMGGPSGMPPMAPPTSGRSATPPSVKYTVPAGWTEKPASGMRLASFEIPSDAGNAEVTIISAGGDSRSNVARWQRQLTPAAGDEVVEKVLQSAEKIEVNGTPAELYVIKGAEGPSQPAFLASIIPWRPDQALFVKFSGPASVADQNQDAFRAFVKSLTW